MQGTDDPQTEPTAAKLSRRAFLGLALGALAEVAVACGQPTLPASPTKTPAEQAAASATPMPSSPTSGPAAGTGTAAGVSATSSSDSTTTLTAAAPSATAVAATYTPVPATPTLPPAPSATPSVVPDRATLMAHWPATEKSRVVVVRHSGVWAGKAPDPAIVLQMLDAGMSALAGTADGMAVWRTLFEPGEHVLLKVNCISAGGPTQPAVAYAVAQRLQDAGLRAEDILIFDRTDYELSAAGYVLNKKGAGVRCQGSQGLGTTISLSQAKVRLRQELDACDALVNLPTPKQHDQAGISVSMKNHYGSVDQPSRLHGNRCDPAIAELNAQPTLLNKTRLIVGAALNVSPGDWEHPERENALLFSFDPVALDTVARDILVRHRQAKGQDVHQLIDGAPQLRTAQKLKLGTTDAAQIDLREIELG